MSLVFITHHNESVYDYGKVRQEDIIEHVQYKSKFKNAIRKERKLPIVKKTEMGELILPDTKIYPNKTMGKPPQQLRKCGYQRPARVAWRRLKDHICPNRTCPLPAVPKFNTYWQKHRFKMSNKDFINENIDRVKQFVRKPNGLKQVDSVRGDTHELLNSGLLPVHTCSKQFAKIPKYLEVHKNALKYCEQQAMEAMLSSWNKGRHILTAEEQKMMDLKEQFNTTYNVYMSLPVLTDTITRKLRKTNLENQLSQLEKDIALLDSNKCILIMNNN
ncbi:enkurin-like isoform X2 [Teleopsis dalmanni]|uniref:enkurin-like isoform X2 n=1 Tax=Teleopsis dalmanni TaxID=139649 RepID=UPI0018CFB1FA|nr:enkurin-like isoform X2 [Teleopsis dalmanni]